MAAAVAQPHIRGLGRLSILAFIPNFLPGVIAYTLPHRPRFAGFLWPLFIVGLIVTFAARPTFSTGWALCLLLGLMIPLFREIQLPWLRQISHPIATYSYGIYLSHQFSLWVIFGPLASHTPALRICVLVGMLAGLPILLYQGIEKPMINIGVRVADRVAGKTSARALIARPTLEAGPDNLELREEVAS